MKGISFCFFTISILFSSLAWPGTGSYTPGVGGKPDEVQLKVDLENKLDDPELWKPLFKAASRLLFNATENQIKISRVTFYKGCHADDADIRVADHGSGDARSDLAGLTKGGWTIHLFQNHQVVGQSTSRGEFGLVHELGHYLFALLEEYRDKSGAIVSSAACLKPKGAVVDTGASIMDGDTTDSVRNQRTEFCDSSNHNKGQTQQDTARMIGAITKPFVDTDDWTFIQAAAQEYLHATLKIPKPGQHRSDIDGFGDEVDFKEIPCPLRVGVALDKSGSMSPNPAVRQQDVNGFGPAAFPPESAPIAAARKGAATFIHLLDQEDIAGLVEVGEGVSVRSFRRMDIDNRYSLLDGLPEISANGKAGWIDLLQAAFQQIAGDGGAAAPPGNEVILLLSDGQQGPGADEADIAGLLSSLKRRGVVVHAIGISNKEAAGLRQAVAETGGEYLFASTLTEMNASAMTLLARMQSRGIIEAQEGRIEANNRRNLSVLVDPATSEREVYVLLAWEGGGNDLSIELTDPDGVVVSPSSPNVGEVDKFDQRLRKVWIKNPKPGRWKIAVKNSSPIARELALQVHSLADKVTVAAHAEKEVVAYPAPLVIKAIVRTDHPVAGASVAAEIDCSNGVHRRIDLFDDGSLANRDERADDGAYSAVFDGYQGNGTCNVEVSVDSAEGRTVAPESRGGFVSKPVDHFVRKTRFSIVVQGAPN